MEEYEKRLIVEHKELCDKISKLDDFLRRSDIKDFVSKEELAIMRTQKNFMSLYSKMLRSRMKIHNIKVKE